MAQTAGLWRANLRSWLDIIATVAMVVAAGTITWTALRRPPAAAPRPPIAVPTEPLSIDGAPTLGGADARVVMIEFSDFECRFCGKFVKDSLPGLKANYVDTGHVQLAFRQLPLPIHTRAERAAESAVCAAEQHLFWPMHDELFAHPDRLGEADLNVHATTVALNMEQFGECMAGKAERLVKRDADMAKAMGLTGTPLFIIGRRQADGRVKATNVVVGARPMTDFRAIFDLLLSAS